MNQRSHLRARQAQDAAHARLDPRRDLLPWARGRASLLATADTGHSKLVRDAGYLCIRSPTECSNLCRGAHRQLVLRAVEAAHGGERHTPAVVGPAGLGPAALSVTSMNKQCTISDATDKQ